MLEMQNEIGNQSEMDNVVVCVCANKVWLFVVCLLRGKLIVTLLVTFPTTTAFLHLWGKWKKFQLVASLWWLQAYKISPFSICHWKYFNLIVLLLMSLDALIVDEVMCHLDWQEAGGGGGGGQDLGGDKGLPLLWDISPNRGGRVRNVPGPYRQHTVSRGSVSR